MTTTIKPIESTRWYFRDGTSADLVPGAKPGSMVKANVTHARKLGLLPGQSQVKNRLAKPQLEAWKIEQHLLLADANHRNEGEDIKVWLSRIEGMTAEALDVAKDRGGAIHGMIEDFLKAGKRPDDPVGQRAVDEIERFLQLIDAQGVTPEKVFVCEPGGFAGRIDIFIEKATIGGVTGSCRIDTKVRTKGFTDDNGKPYYEEGWQLGAYWIGTGSDPVGHNVNLLVDGVTGEARLFCWGQQWPGSKSTSMTKEVLANAFLHSLAEFFVYSSYDPRKWGVA